jgi:hypothetical protein
MPKEAIARVDLLGNAEDQPKLLTFNDRKGQLIGDHKECNDIPGVDHKTTGVELDQEQEESRTRRI